MTNLQKKLNKLMDQKNVSVGDIEKITGLNKNTIYSILAGNSKNPGANTLRLIALALDVSLESLLTDHVTNFIMLSQDQIKAFGDSAQAISNTLVEMNSSVSLETLMLLTKEVHQYSIKINPPHIDNRFVHWIVDKHHKS